VRAKCRMPRRRPTDIPANAAATFTPVPQVRQETGMKISRYYTAVFFRIIGNETVPKIVTNSAINLFF